MISDQTRRLARLHLDVAHALYQAREWAGLSVDTLAERSGLTPDRILMIEEDDTTSLTEVARLCEAMGIDIVSVFPETIDTMQHRGTATSMTRPSPIPFCGKLPAS